MEKNEIEFTETDHIILNSYKYLLDGLGAYLGQGYEIILHSLEELHTSVVHIINGELSGRKVGSPITDFALSMLEDITRNGQISPVVYVSRGKNNTPLKSCTIPIVGEHSRVIGLICINFYTNISLSDFLDNFSLLFASQEKEFPIIENYAESVDDLIIETLNEIKSDVYANDQVNTVNKNKEIIQRLHEKGIFRIKDSVVKVADLLNISKNTVYMHIRNAKPN